MADERRIVIELKVTGSGETGGKGASGSDEKGNDLTDFLRAVQNPLGTMEKATLGKSIIAYNIYQQAKSFVKTTALFQLERYYNLTENYKGEQDLSNTLSVLSHLMEMSTSIVGGAIAGAKAGPVGAVAGMFVGYASWGVNTVFNSWKAFDQQSRELQTMNMQSSYQRVRLGLIDDGRGTQN